MGFEKPVPHTHAQAATLRRILDDHEHSGEEMLSDMIDLSGEKRLFSRVRELVVDRARTDRRRRRFGALAANCVGERPNCGFPSGGSGELESDCPIFSKRKVFWFVV